MPRLTNTADRYGLLAILLHWGMAVALVALVGTGLYMVAMPNVGFDTAKITLILVHKAVGMGVLAAAVLRLAWRMANRMPRLAAGLPLWQQVAARFVHLALYGLMIALPVSGWLMSSAGGYPIPLFGGIVVPDLIGVNDHLFQLLIAIHRWLAYAFILLASLHMAAALHHHAVLKDDTLRKMLPGG
ncbi:cytochrome b [Ramlibacter sp. PS3R-8]|uniref:cytochrome b n=1 Tax=Ramlibacter sp. PS3R-8 TaxID=3133437 RepID=UPI00309CABF8